MKKRYVASPLALLAIAGLWNLVFKANTPVATAEYIQRLTAPQSEDPRHPIEVYQVDLQGGETQSDVLAKLPTIIYPEDKVTFVIDPSFGLGTVVHIQRALPVTIKDGKRVISTRTWANTVDDLLDDINRELGNLDKANFKGTDVLSQDMTVVITRVAKVQVAKKEVIDFETVEKDDPNEWRGTTKVKEAGEKGERTKTYEITREDGEEVSRKLIKDEVTKKPKQKVVVKGTKIKIGKTASGSASWYNLCCTKVASTTFKKGTLLRVTNLTTGKQIEVKVDDTGAFGPAHGNNRILDLHPDHFKALGGTLGQGIMQNIKAEEILNP